jgi:3-methyl-2-oxobutanoate hydroxymethyltransferase
MSVSAMSSARGRFNPALRAASRGKKISLVTAYDAPTARVLEEAGVDWILVGDSVAMVVLGYDTTRAVDIDGLRHHTAAVARGARRTPIIADLPYLSIRKKTSDLLRDAKSLIASGAHAVKIEWAIHAELQSAALIRAGIPLMGHVGLTPQDVKPGESFKVRGTDPVSADHILAAAIRFEKLGAFAVVLECVPESLAKQISERLKVPTIGIGAGRFCDGQVLVFHDLVGLTPGFGARFVKRYANAWKVQLTAARGFVREVRSGRFPLPKNTYQPV